VAEPLRQQEYVLRLGRDGWAHRWAVGAEVSNCGCHLFFNSAPLRARRRECTACLAGMPQDPRIKDALELAKRFAKAGCSGEASTQTNTPGRAPSFIARQFERALTGVKEDDRG
jgi:hypothetical protein